MSQSYYTGSFLSITIAFIPPTLILVLAELTFTCACVFHQDYVPKRWQIWLLFQLFNLVYLFALKYWTAFLGELNSVGSGLHFHLLLWLSDTDW